MERNAGSCCPNAGSISRRYPPGDVVEEVRDLVTMGERCRQPGKAGACLCRDASGGPRLLPAAIDLSEEKLKGIAGPVRPALSVAWLLPQVPRACGKTVEAARQVGLGECPCRSARCRGYRCRRYAWRSDAPPVGARAERKPTTAPRLSIVVLPFEISAAIPSRSISPTASRR
jgi:hypothetical protein